MNNLTDWIKYELYPSLFENIDMAFPEHDFERFSGGWRSQTYLNGTHHKNRRDKTVITRKAPGYILEQGGEVKSLIDYVVSRNKVDFIEAVKILAAFANVKLPAGNFNDEIYQKIKDKAALLEDCNNYFTFCLANSTSVSAEKLKTYLNSRGYNSEDIKEMELGFIPSQEQLFQYLLDKQYSYEFINEAINIKKDTRIGSTHQLTIPYRSGGLLKGFKFRTINDAIKPKYLNNSGLDKIGGFFNISGLKGSKDLVIVEGELDALSASIKGIDNIVAIGGDAINPEQIIDAKNRMAKSFTLCFDNEPKKLEETINKVNRAIEVILGNQVSEVSKVSGINQVSKVYIVILPQLNENKTDVDSFIKEKGINEFKNLLKTAVSYYEFQLQTIIDKYVKLENEEGLNSKNIDNFLDEILETASKIAEPVYKERFKQLFLANPVVKEFGLTAESFSLSLERLASKKAQEIQNKEFKKLISEVSTLQEKGEITKALKILDKKVKEVQFETQISEFRDFFVPIKESEIKQRLANKPESLATNFNIGGEELLLPSGAISILAAPTSHGKTTFLLNLFLNVIEKYRDKEFYFFSYEEDSDSILMNTLSIFLNKEISSNNRKSIKSYFATNSDEFIKNEFREYFNAAKAIFFNELIENRRLNINYANYHSDNLIAAIRFLTKNANPGAIFIDYIQLLNLPEGKYKTYSRQEEIKEICISLKDLAVETGLPIILGAQFNREVTNQLKLHATKIGEAGDIERIANFILGFWNNNFKTIVSDGEANEIKNKGCNLNSNTIFATILKNRAGKVGTEEILSFNGNVGKISNISNTDLLK
jgi:DNA primase